MMNDFKYKYGLDRSRPAAAGSRRLRLVLLFILVLAVTGGIIYCLIPHGAKKPSPAPAPAPVAEVKTPAGGDKTAVDPTTKTGGSVAGGSVAAPVADPAAAGDAPSEQPPAITEDPADAPENPAADAPPVKPDAAAAGGSAPTPEVTATPQKGKPWAGDPPEERRPEVPAAVPTPENATLTQLYAGNADAAGTLIVVRPGESLSRLAVRHRTTVEALRHFNRLKRDNIRIGQKLRVIPGPWRITVDKTRRELILERRQNDEWREFAVFPVGLGRLDSTPEADFVISTRLRHPDWYAPDGRIIRYGDPENQLGEYFLKLARSGTPDKPLIGYGIHGTGDESTVGKNWSHGCVRMRNRDVGLLYYLTPTGTAVRIVPGEAAAKKPEK